jgi:DNA modification methylase
VTPKNAAIHLGDCLQVMKDMPSKSVDIVFTSPPYNLGLNRGRKNRNAFENTTAKGKPIILKIKNGYSGHDDAFDNDEYVRNQKAVLLECWRLLKDDGAIYYNHKPRLQMGVLQTPLDLNPGLPVRQIIIWDKGSSINVSQRFYMPSCEWIVLFAKPDFKLKNTAASGIGDVWRISPLTGGYNPHPAPFPVELPLRAFEGLSGELVLDPYCGSGTVGVACLKTGKRFVGIDNSKEYIEMSKRRLYLAEQGDFTGWHLAGA